METSSIHIYYSRHLDIFYDVYIIYYFAFTMFFIDTFCLFLLLEIFSLYIRVFICLFITRFLFSASSFYSWNLVFSFFFYRSRIAEYLFYLLALFLLLSQLFTFFYYCNFFLLILFIYAFSYDAFFHYWNSFFYRSLAFLF